MTQTVSFRWSKTGGRVATAVGGAALFVSLFLIWSQPDESRFLVLFGAVDRLKANAWQVYSVADALLPALAALLVAVALAPRRWPRLIALTAAIAGLVFVLNALASPPEIPAVTASVRLGLPPSPLIVTGAGEVVAAAALTVSIP